MHEIKLQKRYKFAGDIFKILVEKCGYPVEAATSLLNEIPDAEVVEQTTLERIVERLEEEHRKSEECPKFEKVFRQVAFEEAIAIVKEEGGL